MKTTPIIFILMAFLLPLNGFSQNLLIEKSHFDSLTGARYVFHNGRITPHFAENSDIWNLSFFPPSSVMTSWTGTYAQVGTQRGAEMFTGSNMTFSSLAGLNVFYKRTDSAIYETGRWIDGRYINFSAEPLKILSFPFSEGDTFMHKSHGNGKWLAEQDSFVVEMKQWYARTGLLYLPNDTFADCILTRREVSFFDSSLVDDFWTRTKEDYWVWYPSHGVNNGYNGIMVLGRMTAWNANEDTSHSWMFIYYEDEEKPQEDSSTNSLSTYSSQSLKLYPQPADERFTIVPESSKRLKQLSVFNSQGQEMIVQLPLELEEQKHMLHCKDWPSGTYLLFMETSDGNVYVQKVMVQH